MTDPQSSDQVPVTGDPRVPSPAPVFSDTSSADEPTVSAPPLTAAPSQDAPTVSAPQVVDPYRPAYPVEENGLPDLETLDLSLSDRLTVLESVVSELEPHAYDMARINVVLAKNEESLAAYEERTK